MVAEILNFVNLTLILIVLFIVFDTIKRIKGTFNRGWKVLFFAFSLLFILELLEVLGKLFFFSEDLGETVGELFQIVFYVALIISVAIINKKVKEVNHDNNKKKKSKK